MSSTTTTSIALPSVPSGEHLSEASLKRRRNQEGRRSEEFLCGPVPMPWLTLAMRLSGGSPIKVGLLLWFRSGILRRRTDIPLSRKLLDRAGLPPRTAHDALRQLEKARLVNVSRGRGRCPRVDILDVP